LKRVGRKSVSIDQAPNNSRTLLRKIRRMTEYGTLTPRMRRGDLVVTSCGRTRGASVLGDVKSAVGSTARIGIELEAARDVRQKDEHYPCGLATFEQGAVERRDPLFQLPAPSRMIGGSVTFEPGGRTAWHTHPIGQILIVTAGCGWVQCWSGPKETVRPGDVIWFEPNEKHWHGATATTGMAHIAIAEHLDGAASSWMEHVTDEQYLS
jgi:quercetin dioxygenase-like cupin family protein